MVKSIVKSIVSLHIEVRSERSLHIEVHRVRTPHNVKTPPSRLCVKRLPSAKSGIADLVELACARSASKLRL